MPRSRRTRFDNPQDVRFLTFSCYRRLTLFRNDSIKNVFAQHLEETREEHGVRIVAWVIMPEHVHLMMQPGSATVSLSETLRTLKEPVARKVIKRWRELDAAILPKILDAQGNTHFWQRGGGYDRNIVSDDEFHEKVRYIHDNPCRRRLVESPLDWTWSSARWYAGIRDGLVTVSPVM